MSRVLLVAGSPSAESRSASLLALAGRWLEEAGVEVDTLRLRDLPADDLLYARTDAPAIQQALGRLEAAQGVVIATPIYKAAYAGLLKVFLDLLPQFGFTGKSVLPLATGGSLAHVLAIDYALRPVLASLGPRHIAPGWFVLDKLIDRRSDGTTALEPDTEARLRMLVTDFARMLA